MKLYKVICSCGMEICDDVFMDKIVAEYEATMAQEWLDDDEGCGLKGLNHKVSVIEVEGETECGKPS